jgi:hypothetical protein
MQGRIEYRAAGQSRDDGVNDKSIMVSVGDPLDKSARRGWCWPSRPFRSGCEASAPTLTHIISRQTKGRILALEVGRGMAMKPTILGGEQGLKLKAVMTDADRRAIVLRKFYEVRHSHQWYRMPDDRNITKEDAFTTVNICTQLDQNGLIEWKPYYEGGAGRIKSQGVDVIEGNAQPPIAISIDKRISISDSKHVQVGHGNTQDISFNAEKAAINRSSATVTEKEEAKTLLKTLMENPILSKIFGSFLGG